ncbi:tape measure protein [Bifidobacterium longum]|uniref:tape measure protein n=1 Tax=Bifidobacterium longum TaxID=216816 RepID=UPI001D0888B8|nr:tape measure protein [Bifidobacterium longum]MCB6560168.1 tape measure protein [Bifidobacterium longum]
MAYQLAQAYVQIVPSMKGVGKAIESAFDGPSKSVGQKAGDTAGGGFSRGFSAKLGVISGVASSIATKVIGVFSGLSGQILDASDSTQKFAQTLDFAGVGADQIKKLTTSTQEYANKTVYGIDDIRNTTAQLAANGVPNYDKLAEAAGNLNAVAGGNSETFKSVAMMLTQTAGAGKLTTENWNQLADAIPGASGKLQEAMLKNGAYTGNFRDAMAKGEITSQEFNDALMQLGMNDGAIKAAESTQTFEGAFGNLEATIVDGAANIVNTVKPYITGAVTALGDGIGKAMQWVNDFTGALMKSQGVQTFANGVKSIAGAVGSVIVPISGIIGYLFNFSGKADGAGTAAQRLSDVLGFVGGILQSVGTFVQQNADWMQALAIAVMAGYGAFQLFSIIQTVVGFVKAFSVAETAATAAQWLLNAAMSANPIMILVVAIAALVAGIVWFCTQTETGRQLWADFTGFLQATWQNITDFFQATWQNITQWFSNAAANIQDGWNALTAFIGSIPGRIQAFFASIGQWFVNKFNEARNGITGAFDNAVSFVSSIPGRITGFFGSISSWFADKFSEVRNGIANGFDSAVSFVASIPGRILSALGNLGGLLWNAGASIMQGFLDGLKSIWHNITSFVGNIAGWIADHKGPLPYDRKLLIPAGEAIMGGFRKSLNAGWQQVQADIMGMNVGLSNGFKTPAYVYGGSGMDYTPNTGSASNVHITNYYPQADPWPLSTNDSLDKMTVGI